MLILADSVIIISNSIIIVKLNTTHTTTSPNKDLCHMLVLILAHSAPQCLTKLHFTTTTPALSTSIKPAALLAAHRTTYITPRPSIHNFSLYQVLLTYPTQMLTLSVNHHISHNHQQLHRVKLLVC